MTPPDLTPTEARERLVQAGLNALHAEWEPEEPTCDGRCLVDAETVVETIFSGTVDYDALAVLVPATTMLAAYERAGKVRKTAGYSWDPGFKPVPFWRLTDPEAAP